MAAKKPRNIVEKVKPADMQYHDFGRPAEGEDVDAFAERIFNHITAALTDWFKRHYTDKGLTIEDYYNDYPERRPTPEEEGGEEAPDKVDEG
jgi:hypothetical protein